MNSDTTDADPTVADPAVTALGSDPTVADPSDGIEAAETQVSVLSMVSCRDQVKPWRPGSGIDE